MNKKLLMGMLALVVTLQSANALADKETVGRIIGGIIGGVVGNQVGGGNGKKVATGVGIIAGAIIGGRIGQRLDDADRMALERAQYEALRDPEIRRTYRWNGGRYSRTGAYGDYSCSRQGRHYRHGYICREYYSVIYYRGTREETRGVVCRDYYDRWYEVNERDVSWDDYRPRRRGGGYDYNNIGYSRGGYSNSQYEDGGYED